MPHFIIDCSDTMIQTKSPKEIMGLVYDSAVSTGLFDPSDIKVRINPYIHYRTGNEDPTHSFIHVFAHIMEGRNVMQKKQLSKKIITALHAIFPSVPIISMNIQDFEKATYCNKSMLYH